MAFIIKDPPEFTTNITQWTRETIADGVEMAKEIEKLVNNDVYLKAHMDRKEKAPIPVTHTAAGWTGSAAPYSQTAAAEGLTADDYPILVSQLADGATENTQKAYNKAFGIVAAGTGITGDGTVTFKVYKKPEIDIVVGLKL